MRFPLIACALLQVLFISVQAQDKSTAKFGNVTLKDFQQQVYVVDSNAHAVVLSEVGSSRIEGNNKNWFSLVYKEYKRFHILNKNGFDAADVSIYLYADGEDEEKLDRLKAVTYNVVGGKIVETKLDVKESVFKEKLNKNLVVRKFTFPNVKEGSIIEYEYTVISDYLFNLQPWEFQGAHPRLWSEYNLEIPDFLSYIFLSQGDKKYDISTKNVNREYFKVLDSRSAGATEGVGFESGVTINRWVKKNVPSLKEENFTSALSNHISKIEFQLSEYRQPLTYRNVLGSWPKLASDLMKAENFGLALTKDNGWMKDEVAALTKGKGTQLEQAKNIYAFIRDNLTCIGTGRNTTQTLRNVLKTRKGNVADINLLLTAMLLQIGVQSEPVLLSTRAHGQVYSIYPIIGRFNYVICRAIIDTSGFLLDATEPRMGFGHLPLRCYNGHARVINTAVESLELETQLVNEVKYTTVFIINDEKGKLVGSIQQTPGYYESHRLRNSVKEKGIDQVKADIKKSFGTDITLSNLVIDSLEHFENEVGVKYDFDMNNEKEDIIYFNPMMTEAYTENPFKAAKRLYPVEMPYVYDNTYNMQLEVPEGYTVDELPKSMILKLNEENEGLFEYRISLSGNTISFRSRIKMSRSNFYPDEYDMLREFFNLVVKKHSEQIVFKKKVNP